jgi:hypothetical protein
MLSLGGSMLRLFSLILVLLTLTGCASVRIQNAWMNEQYRDTRFTRFFVLAQHETTTDRRLMEDTLVSAIEKTGQKASAGYRFLPGDDRAEKEEITKALRAANADTLLLVQTKGTKTRTQVSTQITPTLMWHGWYGWYNQWYTMPVVYQYEVAVIEASLFDANQDNLIWSGVAEMILPYSNKISEFSIRLVKELQTARLLAKPQKEKQ